MNETILIQELPLPPSGLARLEEYVPIPKFIGFETTGLVVSAAARDADDSVYQYHFLAQVAHRIILTRIRHSLYIFCTRLSHRRSVPFHLTYAFSSAMDVM